MTNTKRALRVFLCHASGDKPTVKKLYECLVNDGIDAWLDREKILPGQDWQNEIPKAVRNSDAVIVCLSSQSITKEGYIQKEIRYALDVADEKLDGAIFIIPARLEDCEVPERLSKFQWVDLFTIGGYEWLLKALQTRADSIGAIIANKKPDMPRIDVFNSRQSMQVERLVQPRKNDETLYPLIKSDCYFFTHEYATSFKGKYVNPYQKKGILQLTPISLTFSNESFSLVLPFRNILSIYTVKFPPISKPNLFYIGINYVDNNQEFSIGLVPLKGTLGMDTNSNIKEWFRNFEEIPELASKIKRSLLIPS